MNQPAIRYCSSCAAPIDPQAEICPNCGVRQLGPPPPPPPPLDPAIREASGKKLAAGICAILLGSLGIHKFILGMTMPGVIMLLVTLLTCGFGGIPMAIIALVEGIIYLTKTDEEFYNTYMVGKKEWF